MGPDNALPFLDVFRSDEEYIDSLLEFATTNALLRRLCGGVHILDFFTNTPDLYSTILAEDWRDFIRAHPIQDFLDLLLREPLDGIRSDSDGWRDGPSPPASLLRYVQDVRRHLLIRVPYTSQCARNRAVKPVQKLAWKVAVGMNIKKVHEVGLFASYIDQLTTSISSTTQHDITHLIDFGSGQNYLGRALASQPYSKHIVAIETKGHNQDRAKEYDKMARLREKERFMHDKKALVRTVDGEHVATQADERVPVKVEPVAEGVGTIQYVDHHIEDGQLGDVVEQIKQASTEQSTEDACPPQAMVISLHSCGNLVHHGLRSLMLNDAVRAVAMVGCCYNLLTERLSPPTYKLPELRQAAHPRLENQSMACDPHGFPMSERLCNEADYGIKLNITARMMAVQAPQNWGEKDSDGFFTRHFYRALLQRIFLDKGVVDPPSVVHEGGSPLGHSSGTPIIIGSLRKACYTSFVSYVRGALQKLTRDPVRGQMFHDRIESLTDTEIEDYESRYMHRKKELSAIWTLMAFSAGVVESLIVVDRYLWLKEQKEVEHCWVEPVFDYAMSPRNLVVVGIKK